MSIKTSGVMLCVPTYMRDGLVVDLLHSMARQTLRVDSILVVRAGSPDPQFEQRVKSLGASVVHSPKANLPYQRLIGVECALKAGIQVIVFLDDDIRPIADDALAILTRPLEEPTVAAVTADLVMGDVSSPALATFRKQRSISKKRLGSVSPVGTRRPPERNSLYATVEWIRGGVMAVAIGRTGAEAFRNIDMIHAASLGMGLGEDTVIGLRLLRHGTLKCVTKPIFSHPGVAAPVAYTTGRTSYARAVAYSRAVINHYYREAFGASVLGLAGGWLRQFLGFLVNGPRDGRFLAAYISGIAMAMTSPKSLDVWWREWQTDLDDVVKTYRQ